MTIFYREVVTLMESTTPFCLVTLVSIRGEAPNDPGAKALVTLGGLHTGTIGGGKIEAWAIRKAQELLNSRVSLPQLYTQNLQTDIGMTCGGEVTLLFETTIPGRWQIAIFGAGHVAQALLRTLAPLRCTIACIDRRPEWLAKCPETPNLQTICKSEPKEAVNQFTPDTFFVVMTEGHTSDVPILAEILTRFPGVSYIGVIGSAQKRGKICRELQERGVDPNVIEKLRCPIGLPIGNNSPEEIAISVAGELLQVRGKV